MHPPSNVDITSIPKEVAKTFHKNRGRPRSYELPTINLEVEPTTQSSVLNLNLNKVFDLFKKQASSPWGWLETNDKFYFFKSELPPTGESYEISVHEWALVKYQSQSEVIQMML